jgi:hypothetical protein
VTGADGTVTTLTARHAVVVATGSSVLRPGIAGLREAAPWTSRKGKYQARAVGGVIVARAKGEAVDDRPWGRHAAAADKRAVPQVIFTDPKVASVGLTAAAGLRILNDLGDDVNVIAGGQSLLPIMSMRLATPAHLVDITGIPELHRATASPSSIRYGSAPPPGGCSSRAGDC